MPTYLEIRFLNKDKPFWNDILIEALSDKKFEGFFYHKTGFNAYIEKNKFDKQELNDTLTEVLSGKDFFTYEVAELPDINWNEEWEKNFSPIIIDNQYYIRASFHPKHPNIKKEILIEPKMAFGTGHHTTTCLIASQLLDNDVNKKVVLDMGCGTGILAIMASLEGAQEVIAIDNDNWATNNATENIQANHVKNVKIVEGDAVLLDKYQTYFDVILANINRNIIIEDIPKYVKALKNGGILIISGFYSQDIPLIEEVTLKNNLKKVLKQEENNWVVLKFELR